ncbi:endonuclease III [Acrasis kona]|uniref:Endonuclease III homolog n=1 Tax=Acrasis kona TaxID=1008807 RepID=A0AAW2Z8H5_9EUKA
MAEVKSEPDIVKQEINENEIISEKIEVNIKQSTFQKQYSLIREMRENPDGPGYNAPVDTMGCQENAAKVEGSTPEEIEQQQKIYRYQTLISLMLSSQTKDQVTAAAMAKLKQHGCTIDQILETSTDTLEKLIYPASFYKRKAVYILKATKMLKDIYNGDVPKDVKEIMKLPGVGPKMAYLTMSCGWKEVVGIGVDTHVHRISNRLEWVHTKVAEQTRIALQEFLPKDEWDRVNYLLVGFGQTVCSPIGPKCNRCSLSKVEKLCPYYENNVKEKKTKKKSVKKEKKLKEEEEEDIEDLVPEEKLPKRRRKKIDPGVKTPTKKRKSTSNVSDDDDDSDYSPVKKTRKSIS